MSSKSKAKVRQASFEDYQQIASLESRYGMARSVDHWTHLWLGNPLYRELEAGWPIGWVVEDDNKQIVGTMEIFPCCTNSRDGESLQPRAGRRLSSPPTGAPRCC